MQNTPNACRTYAASMLKAGTLQEQAHEARARIPRSPRSKHTPQDAVLTELTKAGVTVDGKNAAVRQIVARHLRDSGYAFYRESMLVLE